ncbi:hypothetical protein [Pedobacter sp. R20-19]|uniref:hypothetical protein n=1 Tax=Pedobacter sp. R20-19 TaxID=1270196 RepID=UPI000492FF05|nr:hypothetical protein [Pedobacter sp. R20-19]
MNTTCSLLKQYTLVLILLFSTTIFIYSCKKDKDNHSVLSVEEIKKWYITNANAFNTESKIFEHKNPDFTKSFAAFKDGQQVTEFNFDSPNKLVFDNGTSTDAEKEIALANTEVRLLFFSPIDTKTISAAAFMVIIGKEKQDLTNVHYKDFNQFSGRIIFYNSKGALANGYEIEHGNILKSFGKASLKPNELLNLKLHNQAKIASDRIASGTRLMLYDINSNCFEFVTTSEQACVSFNATRSFLNKTGVEESKRQKLMVGNDMYCKWMISGEYVGSECQSSGNDGGYNGGSGNTGGQEGGGSGSGGDNSNKEIIDSVKNPCLKASLSLAISNGINNQITGYMNSTFGTSSQKNLTFYQSSTLASQDDGITNGSQYDINIYLNSNTLPSYSKEYTIATIYHEVLHAYLNSLFQPNSNGQTFINIPNQHEYMATNYVTVISSALTSKFPEISSYDAWGLAWGGLQETSLWDVLTESDKQQIIDINKNYSNRGSLKKGDYCN